MGMYSKDQMYGFGCINGASDKYVYGVVNGATTDWATHPLNLKTVTFPALSLQARLLVIGSGLTNLPVQSVDAYTKTESDAKYQPKGNYADATHTHNEYLLKAGNWSCNGSITATGTITGQDCIATSDERLKDNITTAPVGFIDELKGREWEWKSRE